MWILPKSIISAYVQDAEALISDLNEQSQICEQSLLARSKHSRLQTWSQKWKRDTWTQHLSGRILKPSHGKSFVTAWTSSLEVIHANHSPQQANDSDETTLDTFGRGLQMELELCDPESASSKTSKDTSHWDLERLLANWKDLVTRRRGEYSQRVKSAHLTNGSECSSWPTTAARDWKGCGNAVTRKDGKHRLDTLEAVVIHGQAAPANPSTDGSRLESWGTPAANDANKTPHCEVNSKQAGLARSVGLELQKQWATPSTMDHLDCRSAEGVIKIATGARKGRSMPSNLRVQVDPQTVDIYQKTKEESWATPQTRDHKGSHAESFDNPNKSKNLNDQMEKVQTNGKLNPRWVETLMGLPIGWTMPSCSSPLTIAPMNCDCLETESSQPPQNELLELF